MRGSPLRELTCHMGSHSVTCHLAAVTFLPYPSQSWYSIFLSEINNQAVSWFHDTAYQSATKIKVKLKSPAYMTDRCSVMCMQYSLLVTTITDNLLTQKSILLNTSITEVHNNTEHAILCQNIYQHACTI